MKLRRSLLFILGGVGFFLPAAVFAVTGTIDATDYQSRLCSNADCSSYSIVYWKTTDGAPVTITDTGITGDIWSANFGWVNLNPTQGGVHNTTSGVLSGYGWGETASWVNFSPTHGGVTINTNTGEFSGWAWVSGAGWMQFDCSLGVTACVKTSWRPTTGTTTTTGTTGGASGSGDGSGTILIHDTTGTTGTTGTTTATTTGTTTTGTGTTTSGGTTTTGTTTSGTTTHGTIGTGTTATGTTGTTTGTTGTGTTASGTTASGTTTTGTVGGTTTTGTTGVTSSGGTTGGGNVLKIIADSFGAIGKKIGSAFSVTVQTTKTAVSTGTGEATATTVTAAGVVAGLAATVATKLFLNPLSFSELILIPERILSLLLVALGLKRRRRSWGIVYDSITKQPLDPACVTLRNADGKDIGTSITNLDGSYGFTVTEPGSYTLFVHKADYTFPSQKLVGHDHDELYRDLYFGEHFFVGKIDEPVTKNIPMDPEKFNWSEFTKKEQRPAEFYSKRDKALRKTTTILFAIGFIVAAIVAVAVPNSYNITLFLIYCILLFVRERAAYARPFGEIIDTEADIPISFAIIRISSAATGFEVMSRIADAKGHYYALLPNGEYRVRIDRKLVDGTYQTIATDLPATVTKGHLAKTFSLNLAAFSTTPEPLLDGTRAENKGGSFMKHEPEEPGS